MICCCFSHVCYDRLQQHHCDFNSIATVLHGMAAFLQVPDAFIPISMPISFDVNHPLTILSLDLICLKSYSRLLLFHQSVQFWVLQSVWHQPSINVTEDDPANSWHFMIGGTVASKLSVAWCFSGAIRKTVCCFISGVSNSFSQRATLAQELPSEGRM